MSTTIYTGPTLDTNSTGWSGVAIRVKSGQLTIPCSNVSVTVSAASTGNHFKVDHVSIGILGAATFPSMATLDEGGHAQPVELTYSGGHGFDLAPGASITSDVVTFSASVGDFLVVNFDCNSGVSVDIRLASVGGVAMQFKTTTAAYNTAAVSGFSSNSLSGIVTSIQANSVPYSLALSVGAFSLTGVAATLKRGLHLLAGTGSFTLTGHTALLVRGYHLACSAGSFIMTGIAIAATDIRGALPFKRKVAPTLQKLRSTDPTLDQ